jgi:hypothetical protein
LRHDAVLIGDPDGPGNGLDRFEVARLHLLFQFYNHDESMENPVSYDLAYVQWYQKKSLHDVNQMMIVELLDKFDVISIEAIYRPIHLIPRFYVIKDLKTTARNHIAPDEYREFYVNSYVDHHAYNNCY